MAAAVDGKLSARVQVVGEIPRTARGKHRFLIQNLETARGEAEAMGKPPAPD
jgi:hypothetical protein